MIQKYQLRSIQKTKCNLNITKEKCVYVLKFLICFVYRFFLRYLMFSPSKLF